MAKYKKPFLFALCLLPIALVGGWLTGIYQLDLYGEALLAEVIAQLGSRELLPVITAVQSAGYALFCGFFGCILAEKLGLWRPVRLQKRPLLVTLGLSALGGALFSLDYWTFGSVIEEIQASAAVGMTPAAVGAALLYGGVMEEVMLRLFFLSLLAFVIWKLFFHRFGREEMPQTVFVLANILAAVLFAAGHLPATVMTFGTLTPLLLIRCFLFNGGAALLFGWLYRKYGFVYAVISHMMFHVVSKLICFIFV